MKQSAGRRVRQQRHVRALPHAYLSTIFQYESFPNYPAVPEFPVIASAYMNSDSVGRRACQRPLGHAHVSADPVPVVAVVNVRKTFEAHSQPFSYGRFAREAFTPGLRSTRHVQRAVVGKEFHDGIEVVRVERIDDCLQCCDGSRLRFVHVR